MTAEIKELFDQAKAGDRSSLARLISACDTPGVEDQIDQLTIPLIGSARVIGITGPPGAGKSSLTNQLITFAKERGRVAVISVDPSSPFSGGAFLGDRVRMKDHFLDSDVFIRSFGSRGDTGGLSLSTNRSVRVFDACGYSTVIVETVGVGQVELDIARAVDSILVVLNPNSGDGIQTDKAGIIEIGDVFAINKSDLPGADTLKSALDDAIALSHGDYLSPVVKTSAKTGEGIDELWVALDSHFDYLSSSGELASRRSRRLLEESKRIAMRILEGKIDDSSIKDAIEPDLVSHESTPTAAANVIVSKLGLK